MKIEELGNGWNRITISSQEDMDEAREAYPHMNLFNYPEGALRMSFYGKDGKVLENSVMFVTEGEPNENL